MTPADAYHYEGLSDAPIGLSAEPAEMQEELIEDMPDPLGLSLIHI